MQLKFIVSELMLGLGFVYFWVLKEIPPRSVHVSNITFH